MKPSIREAELDLVLADLITTRPEVALLIASRLGLPADFSAVAVSRQVQHVDVRGSADLVVRFLAGDSLRAVALIENKIDAGFTQDQPARYAASRDALQQRNSALVVRTLLIAPAIYLSGSRLMSGFNATLSYEDLLPLASAQAVQKLALAIERSTAPYEPEPVAAVMNFFEGYAKIAKATAPWLVLKRNPNSAGARPEASRTIYFDAVRSGFRRYPFLTKRDGSPADLRMSHQCWDSASPSASIKVMIGDWGRHLGNAAPLLNPSARRSELYVRTAGKSLAIVADTPKLNNHMPADLQFLAIETALERAAAIRDWWNGAEDTLWTVSSRLS